MAHSVTFLVAVGVGASALASRASAQPIHDLCTNALPLNPCGGIYTGTTVGATPGMTPSCSSSATNDVWHSVTIATRGYLDVYTCPVSFDTVISLHTRCPSDPQSVEVACNNNSAYCGAAYPTASYFRALVDPGTYFIRVAGTLGGTGGYTLNTNFAAVNDFCDQASPIGDSAILAGTICATIDGSADCAPLAPAPDVWYRYQPACDGTLTAYICPASFDTVLSIHSGCPGTVSNQIACNDDSLYCGAAYPHTSSVTIPVLAANSYVIRVSGFNGAIGTFVLNTLLVAPTPPNDSCANASPVGVGDTPFATCGATTDGPEEFLCGFPTDPRIDSDIWYRYTSPCTGRTTISLSATNFANARFAVYNASCPTASGQVVACSNLGNVFFPTVAGRQFLIRVGGLNSQGSGVVRIHCAADPCYPNCDGSTAAPILNVNDFICFQTEFAAGGSYANCDSSTSAPVLNINDFICFQQRFAAGCP